MFPKGFLGTRADLLCDIVFLSTMATPFVLAYAIRLARAGKHRQHRALQTGLLSVLLVAVVLFELDVRLSGGSGSLMRGSSYAGTGQLKALVLAHVGGNVVTFFAWLYLVVASWRRFETALPGGFSARHRRLGRWVFAGTLYGAVTAVAMYTVGFVL